jgi:hypothetical protein
MPISNSLEIDGRSSDESISADRGSHVRKYSSEYDIDDLRAP